jgi:anaerobic selenocysteine-containing dehydrogenase
MIKLLLRSSNSPLNTEECVPIHCWYPGNKKIEIMGINPFETVKEEVALSPEVSDEVKTSTCYMCACRCGIKVHLKNNQIRYIEGNPDHPVNKGVLCAKGSSGIMHQNAPPS